MERVARSTVLIGCYRMFTTGPGHHSEQITVHARIHAYTHTRIHAYTDFCYLRFQLRGFAGLANMVQHTRAAPSAYSLPATTSPANNGQRKDSRLTFRCVNSTQLSQTCRRDSTTN
ncbi:hypothetical protein P3342_000272 [Pyrenophora teres f. teres]|nr:hypothetical protein P3342_000272 [Pyrenophora teres f. teres]